MTISEQVLNNISKRKWDRYDLCIIAGVLLYAIVLSLLSLYRLSLFQLELDLAIFNQAFWTTTHTGGILENTLDAPGMRSHLGNHFSPILLLLIPFYILFPGPQLLLISQSFLLGLGALPIYLCGRDLIGKKAALLVGFAYLLYPALHGVNLYDFHEVAFLPFILGMGLWGYLTGRKNLMLVFCLAALLIKEDASLIVGMIGLFGLIKTRKESFNQRWQYLILILVPFLILILYMTIIKPFFCQGDLYAGSQFLAQYADPVGNLMINNNYRISYLIMTFLPLLFLPLASPGILLISLLSFLEILLSPTPFYYSVGYQYSALIIPVLFMATISTLEKIRRNKRKNIKKSFYPFAFLILLTCIISSAIFSPALMPIKLMQAGYGTQLEDHSFRLKMIGEALPDDASVATQLNLLPILSERREIWHDYHEGADIIMIDTTFSWRAEDFSDDEKKIEEKYDTTAEGDGIFLFVRKDLPDLKDRILNNLNYSVPPGGS